MIEATCTACGKLLGSFATQAEYVEWREKNSQCECGASLAAALFTSYTKAEKVEPKVKAEETKSGEEQPQEETKEEKKPTGFPGDILRGRRK
jgi:hypothetical protein